MLIQDIAWALQEPYTDGTTWTGNQFTILQVTNAIQARRDRFKVEAGIGLSLQELEYTGGTSGTFLLPDNIIDVRRVAWKDINGNYSVLWKADQYTLTAGSRAWFQTPGVPTDYSTILQQPLALQLSPPPADKGWLNIISLNSGVPLNPAVAPTVLNIPDDLAWVVKFGALADLFGQDGIGKDPDRAAYCEGRWKDGIQLARIYNNIRMGYLNGVPSFIDAIEELDQSSAGWMMAAQGIPSYLTLLGTVAATFPVADGGSYSLDFDLCPKFPVPNADSDWIQCGQEYLDFIVDYAEHLANVKIGASELKETARLYDNLVKAAAVVNDRLRARSQNFEALSDKSRLSEKINPRRQSDMGRKELDYANS